MPNTNDSIIVTCARDGQVLKIYLKFILKAKSVRELPKYGIGNTDVSRLR